MTTIYSRELNMTATQGPLPGGHIRGAATEVYATSTNKCDRLCARYVVLDELLCPLTWKVSDVLLPSDNSHGLL